MCRPKGLDFVDHQFKIQAQMHTGSLRGCEFLRVVYFCEVLLDGLSLSLGPLQTRLRTFHRPPQTSRGMFSHSATARDIRPDQKPAQSAHLYH